MHASLLILFFPVFAMADMPGTYPLGTLCTSTWECANGASCYASSSSLSTLCGNAGATCTSDTQCAFNTCVSGSCSGPLTSSPSTTTSTSPSAPTGSGSGLTLGTACTSTTQCANNAQCYAVNAMEVPHCGNFGATCSSDSQCAFNTCVSGSCSGSSSSVSSSVSSTSSVTSSASGTKTTASSATLTTVTSTGIPKGFTTSVAVVGGVTSSVLVNAAGATTSFGAVATSVTTSVKGNSADKMVGGGSGMLVLFGAVAVWLL